MKKVISLVLPLFLNGAIVSQTMPSDADPRLWQRALAIHRRAIVVDGHNDITSPMVDEDFDLATNTVGKFRRDGDPFHTDIGRWKAGGMTGQFMSIYVSGNTLQTGGSMRRAMELLDATYREAEKHPRDLMMCTSAAEIRRAKRAGKICLLMGIEGGYAIENSLYALREFYRLGIRYMTLTHNVTHDWADTHVTGQQRHNGLTDFGKEVVREMNRLGMLVDISHVSAKVMQDVLDISTAPVIASHSGARAVNDHTRNVPDEVLRRLPKNGGVIMVVFYPVFLDARVGRESSERSTRLRDQIGALREKYKDNPQALQEAERALLAANPIYNIDYKRIVDHIDHIKRVAGIDHVGLGSDFDGVDMLPDGIRGVEDLPVLTYEMLRRGYTEQEIRKVLGENFLRAFTRAEQVARITTRRISGEGSLRKLPPPVRN